jgi:DNA-binding beta-propeller fold protein YncE
MIGLAPVLGALALLVAFAAPAAAVEPVGGLTRLGCLQNTGGADCPNTPALDSARGIAISPDGSHVYVAAANSDAIAIFARGSDGSLLPAGCIKDADSSLSCGSSVQGLDGPRGVIVSPDGGNVYVTAHDASPPGDIVMTLDRAPSGALSDGASCQRGVDAGQGACGSATFDDPEGLAMRLDGGVFYAATSGGVGGIARFTRGAGGDITYEGTFGGSFINAPFRVAVHPSGNTIYVASSGSARVAWFPLDSDGAPQSTGSGCIIDPPGGGGCTATAAGLNAARGIAASPDGQNVYVASQQDDAVVTLSVGAGGALSAAGCISAQGSSSGCASSATGLDGASEVIVSPDGHNVYVASGVPGNALVGFARAPDGSLTPLNCVVNAGGSGCATAPALNNPFGLAMSPDGNFLYATASVSDSVTWLARNQPDPPVPTPAPSAPPTPAPRKPVLTGLTLSPARFRIGSLLPRLSVRRRAVPTGTTIRFGLDQAASVRLTFERALPGRRVGRSCRRPSRANRRRRPCTRYVRAGSLVRAAHAGLNRVRFQGRLLRRRAFAPGRYRLTALPSTRAAGLGAAKRKTFTLLAPARRRR